MSGKSAPLQIRSEKVTANSAVSFLQKHRRAYRQRTKVLFRPLIVARKHIVSKLERLWPSFPVEEVYRNASQINSTLGFEAKSPNEQHLISVRPVIVEADLGISFVGKSVVWGSTDFAYRENSIDFRAPFLIKRRMKEAIVLNGHFGGSYYHLYADVLSKVFLAQQLRIAQTIPLLISKKIAGTPFFKEAVALGGLLDRAVVEQHMGSGVEIRQAHLLRAAYSNLTIYNAMRNHFHEVVGAKECGERRVLLARHPRYGRGIANLEQLEEVAKRHGFEIIQPEGMPLSEQIRLFAETRFLIGVHGAGLVNMMFRKGPMSIIELCPPNFLSANHYRDMAEQRQYSFTRVVGTSNIDAGARADGQFSPKDVERAILTELAL